MQTIPYYTGYANLSTTFAGQAFRMLGQPCNQFGGQEPGGNDEIANCVQYVRPGHGYVIPSIFALTQKGDVNGVFQTPLFASLIKSCGGAAVGWNFEAWLISKTGQPLKRYITGFGPLNMAADISAALAAEL